MKKRVLFLLLMAFVFLSCGKKDEFAEFGEEYVPGYDDNRSEIKGYDLDDSILYVVQEPYIYCIDLEAKEYYPLCSKPNCSHSSEECNAFKPQTGVSRYQNQLIVKEPGNFILSYLRTDGSGGETIGMFSDFEEDGVNYRYPIAHRGYIYGGLSFFDGTHVILQFARLPISGGEPEILYEESVLCEQDEQYNRFFANYYGVGSNVYFSTYEEEISKIRCYDTKSGEVSLIYEGERNWVSYPKDGQWYWMTRTGVYRWNPKTGEEHCLHTFKEDPIPSSRGVRSYNDGFLLPSEENPTLLEFYDWEGQEVAQLGLTVPNPRLFFIEGHHDNYLVCRYSQGNDLPYAFAILDTDKLGDPNLEWMIFDFLDEDE